MHDKLHAIQLVSLTIISLGMMARGIWEMWRKDGMINHGFILVGISLLLLLHG